MTEISKTGEGLAVVIDSSYSQHHDWMTLASWYSIQKNLPDAKVIVAVTRGLHGSELFTWPWRFGAIFFQHSNKLDPVKIAESRGFLEGTIMQIKIEPDVMAVRPFDPEWVGPYSVKEDCFATFVSYREGCGTFVPSKWINRKERPFVGATRAFARGDLTVNEKRVFEVWDKLGLLTSAL